MEYPDGTYAWYMSSDTYCKAAIENVECWLENKGIVKGLPTRAACVFPSNWKPELDTSDELDDDDANYYMQQVGVLKWLVELGRIDIATKVSMLAAFSACPRKGHLEGILHLYGYLKKNPRSKLVFDPSNIDHDA